MIRSQDPGLRLDCLVISNDGNSSVAESKVAVCP